MINNILLHRQAAFVAAATAVAATLAACSSSGSSPTHATPAPGTSSASATAPAANALSVTARDPMRFEIHGAPQAGLVTITFANKAHEAHEMTYQQLKPGKTLADVKAALHSPDAEKEANGLVVDPQGETTGPAILAPGRSEAVTTRIAAGHYVVLCFLPGAHGMPHALMGMVGEFTVGGTSAARAPKIDGTIALTDHHIALPAGFARGGTFAVTNRGSTPHDVSVARLHGAPLIGFFQCVAGSFGKGTPIDKCPGELTGGVTTLQAGQTSYLHVDALPKGSYGYVSTQGDGADFKAGLNGTFTVK